MGAYVKHGGNYTYNTESSYNYEVNGSVINIDIISTPTKVFGGESLISVLASTMLRLQVQQVPMGLVEDIDVTALEFLGDRAQLNLVNALIEENLWVEDYTFSFNALIDDYMNHTHNYDMPNVVVTGLMFVKLKMKNWQYFNTYDNLIQNVTFDIPFALYPQIIQLSGELDDISVSTDLTQFNIAGRYINAGSFSGTLRNYLDAFTVSGTLIDNVDDDEVSYNAWDLLKLGFVFTPDKNAQAQTFSGSQATIVFNVANTFFSGCDNVGEDTTKVTITFKYFDLVTETEQTATFVCELRLYGLEQLYVNSSERYFVEGLFNRYVFFKTLNDSLGNSIRNTLLDINTDLYYALNITITNTDTNVNYGVNDELPNGHYTIQGSATVNPLITITSPIYNFSIYKGEIADMEVLSYYTYYRVGSEFKPSSFVVTLKRLIYGNDYYNTRIYYPRYTTNYDGHIFSISDVPSVDVTFSYVDENYGTYTKTISINVVAPIGDYMYVFNKKTLVSEKYGEIQQGFNFNFVLDQTKDNAKIEILNRKKSDIKPFTIVYLESTDTWWIVKSDDVTRYTSESTPLYKHTLNLLGAIEILNARDLTNCGFNVDHYTIDTFLTRLIKMSDFELPIEIDYGTYLDPNKKVDYLKTFENYSPLSAIKELCNGMNVKPELNFVMNGNTVIKGILTFVPNSGTNAEEIDISVFDDAQEKVTNDKENYGSKVVSNIQNCTSGETIRFPATGTVALSGAEYRITYENACIRLPTKAKEVKELDICTRYVFAIYDDVYPEVNKIFVSNGDAYNEKNIQDTIQSVLDAEPLVGFPQEFYDLVNDVLVDNRKSVIEAIKEISTIRLINGADYDTQSHEWNGKQVKLAFKGYADDQESQEPSIGYDGSNSIGFNEKRYYDTFPHQSCIIYWEQGSDLIKNFYFFNPFTEGNTGRTWREENNHKVLVDYNGRYKLLIAAGQFSDSPFVFNAGFSMAGDWAARYVVYYVPQNDIKVKIENGILDNDTNLYNQNGTLVSGKAVSKLLNSHAIAISSNQITRYKRYYSYDAIPKIGQIVNNNDVKYVINNVSIDFVENDSNLYALDCMFTLTKQIACKSTMISANSVIRDYPTPQNNNIRRIQCYRDYIVLTYDTIPNYQYYLNTEEIFAFFDDQFIMGGSIGYTDNHTALIKVDFYEPNDGLNYTYYYQLQSFKYNLDKMFVEVIDFKDNNIIGYSGQNTRHPFTFREWYQHIAYPDQIVIPISYVNSVGELDSVDILVSDNDQLTTIYNNLVDDFPDLDRLQSIYSASCVIPSEVYEECENSELYDIELKETEYDKDGLEIPVFQYSCQINGINGIEISNDILKGENANENEIYVYRYKVVDNVYLTEENGLIYADDKEMILRISKYELAIFNNVRISFDITYHKFNMTFYSVVGRRDINISGGSDYNPTLDNLNALGKTILIYRNKIDLDRSKVYDNEFVMALNKCNQNGSSGTLSINIATYKLK